MYLYVSLYLKSFLRISHQILKFWGREHMIQDEWTLYNYICSIPIQFSAKKLAGESR